MEKFVYTLEELAAKRNAHTSVFDAEETKLIRAHYKLGNAILSLMKENVDAGFEREISDEMIRREGISSANNHGIRVPYCVLRSTVGEETLGRPDHGTVDGIGGSGHNAIPTVMHPELYLSPLAAKCILSRIGVRFVDGLVGNVAIPKGGNIGVQWVTAEGGNASKKNATFGQITATPHTCSAHVDVTRQLVIQSCLPMAATLSDLVIAAIQRAVDAAGFAGTGSDGQPTGITETVGVNAISGIVAGAPTRANVLDFLSAVETANADVENLRWVAPTAVKTCLASTLDYAELTRPGSAEGSVEKYAAVSSARHLYEKGAVEDIPLAWTNLAPAKKLILGDFAQMLILGWSEGVTLFVDKFSFSTTGGIRLVVYKDVDIAVANPKAFAVGTVLA